MHDGGAVVIPSGITGLGLAIFRRSWDGISPVRGVPGGVWPGGAVASHPPCVPNARANRTDASRAAVQDSAVCARASIGNDSARQSAGPDNSQRSGSPSRKPVSSTQADPSATMGEGQSSPERPQWVSLTPGGARRRGPAPPRRQTPLPVRLSSRTVRVDPARRATGAGQSELARQSPRRSEYASLLSDYVPVLSYRGGRLRRPTAQLRERPLGGGVTTSAHRADRQSWTRSNDFMTGRSVRALTGSTLLTNVDRAWLFRLSMLIASPYPWHRSAGRIRLFQRAAILETPNLG